MGGQSLQLVRTKFERLGKRIALSGLVSRHEAEQALREGRVRVNGVVASNNFQVPDTSSVHMDDIPIPAPEVKLWAVNKPKKVLCSLEEKDDIKTIRTLMQRWREEDTRRSGKTINQIKGADDRDLKHFNIVNSLGISEEGIVLLSNCGHTANILRDPSSNIESVYMVRVRGTVNADVFRSWRPGVKAHGKWYGHVLAHINRRAEESTWVRVALIDRPNCSLYDLFQSVNLDIQRLRRLQFGHYRATGIPEENLLQLEVHKTIKHLIPKREERDALVPIISPALIQEKIRQQDTVATRII